MAYFLLLTTGMFVCIFHCAAEKLIEKVDNNTKINNGDKDDDNCKHNDSCDCCKKHDNFVIKENIKPGFDFLVSDTALLANYISLSDFNRSATIVNNIDWPECHAPPCKSGKSISIILHSLQI